jgi:Ca-activated chloride channel family protein
MAIEKKGDCADIEMIVPVGPLQKETAIQKSTAISPKGKTPISDSISRAVDKVKGKKGQAPSCL